MKNPEETKAEDALLEAGQSAVSAMVAEGESAHAADSEKAVGSCDASEGVLKEASAVEAGVEEAEAVAVESETPEAVAAGAEAEAELAAGNEQHAGGQQQYYEEIVEFEALPAEEVEVAYRQIDAVSAGMEPFQVDEELTLYSNRVPEDAAARLLGETKLQIDDLVPGLYEGGYKLWDGAKDMAKFLCTHYAMSKMLETAACCPDLQGKRVLELGCGHGLPGICMLMAGCDVHFQDYNKEVLREITVPNALANVQRLPIGGRRPPMRFFAGDWCFTGEFLTARGFGGHYDIIVVCDGIYDLDSQYRLLECIKQVLQPPHGYVYIASQNDYPDIGGGTDSFRELVKQDGIFEVTSMFKVDDPETGGVREIIKLAFPLSIVPYFL